eukprot:gene925-1168_t
MDPFTIPDYLIPTFNDYTSRLPPLGGSTKTFSPLTWFLGPKGENQKLFQDMVNMALDHHIDGRKQFHPEDSPIFPEGFTDTPEYKAASAEMKEKTAVLLEFLKKSLPYSSFRYIGHMCSDVTIGAVIGYIATILYNPNNVTIQASPVTTYIEMAVGNDLCRMVGYPFAQPIPKDLSKEEKLKLEIERISPWGHITSGGTVANAEAFWAHYWSRCIPLALQQALLHEETLILASSIKVKLANGKPKELSKCTPWEAFNLDADENVNLPYRTALLCGVEPSTVIFLLKKYHPSTEGILEFFQKHGLKSPVFFAPGTGHYSIPKAAALLGLGSNKVKYVPVDDHARMDISALKAHLQACLDHQIPVINVTGVMGTTEESSVDNFEEILKAREEFRRKGLNFDIHVDAAWGGYFLSCIRSDYKIINPEDVLNPAKGIKKKGKSTNFNESDPQLYCSDYFVRQMKHVKLCDSITIDPHKSGYIPYPAGSLCYRNSKLRDILVYTASVIGGSSVPTVGIYGIEGSKPGAAPVAVYLTHSILRTSKSGYGMILKRCLLNTKLFYLRLLWLAAPTDNFVVIGVPVPPTQEKLDYLKSKLIVNGKFISSEEISKDPTLVHELAQIGPDQNIVCYSFNFKEKDGTLNKDYQKYVAFNNKIYERFDYIPETGMKEFDLVVSNTEFGSSYGAKYLNSLANRIGLTNVPFDPSFPVLRSTIMDPMANETTTGSSFDKLVPILKTEVIKFATLAQKPTQS